MGETIKLDEDTYAKKGFLGWRLIFPIQKDMSKPLGKGNVNWKNVLIPNKSQFIWLVIFLAILFFSAWAYHHDVSIAKECLDNPCKFCYGFDWNDSNFTINLTNYTYIPLGFEPGS